MVKTEMEQKNLPCVSVMIQGTASSVGKSIITAGLCRIFKQDGYRVSPFKSQNMALNSFITREGKEMGRAQVVQAEAAGVEPSVKMNPILLKPTTDRKAQVILNGEVYKNMSAADYHNYKTELKGLVKNVYEELAVNNDIIVIEGAGSPAEINLRENDLVNMGMAEIADAPVILVGDIDRGGVFASLAGTMLLLTEEEKARVKGVIINKFRGDLEILKPGLRMIEEIIKVPVLGVLPYTKLNIEDEDSLAERFNRKSSGTAGEIDVAVVKIPHISNFTDFNALENLERISLRYVDRVSEMGEPDLVIIPGSKNTIEDMQFLRRTGFENEIIRLCKGGSAIFGICGGFQMLGLEIDDPLHTESNLNKIHGMGLLNINTVFHNEKVMTQVLAQISSDVGLMKGLKGSELSGYEIHMGVSGHLEGCMPFIEVKSVNGEERTGIDGIQNSEGTVFGTYIHGIFDNMEFTKGFVNNLRKRKGIEASNEEYTDFKSYKESQYDMLADMMRENMDMDKIYEIVFGRVKK